MIDPNGEGPLAIHSSEPDVISACRKFYRKLLRIEPGIESILETQRQYPDEPALQMACALLWLFGQTPEAQSQSGEFLAQLRSSHSRLTPREKAWLTALENWHAGSFDAAASGFETITSQWPEDLPAVKSAEFIYYILGQQASGRRFLHHMQRLEEIHSEDADYLAMKAFAHELCGEIPEATETAEKALSIAPFNPWAQHALEHVLLWEGSSADSLERLESWLPTWDEAGRVIHCHNAWHVALAHLDRTDTTRAFAVYDKHVWGRSPQLVVEQLDAIAFLWRAEMAGHAVETERFRSIVPHILPLAETLFMPFVTAHYAYALARAGEKDALDRVLARVDERSQASDPEARRAWQPVGRSIIHASADLGWDRPGSAADWMEPVMDQMTQIGGSDAQDDLFRFAFMDSLQKSGRRSDARDILLKRLSAKAPSPLEQELLGQWGA